MSNVSAGPAFPCDSLGDAILKAAHESSPLDPETPDPSAPTGDDFDLPDRASVDSGD